MSAEKAVSNRDLDGIYPHHTGRKSPTGPTGPVEQSETGTLPIGEWIDPLAPVPDERARRRIAELHRECGVLIAAASYACDQIGPLGLQIPPVARALSVLRQALDEVTT